MPSLNVYRGIQTLKIGPTSFVIHPASIRQGNQKGPFRLVRVHVQLLSFFFGHIVFDNVWFSVVQLQLHQLVVAVDVDVAPFGTKPTDNGMDRRVNGKKTRLGQNGIFPAAQGLLGVRVGGILTSTGSFRRGNHVIALGRRQAYIGYIDMMFFRNRHPIQN
jgi:hypothetical protein